MSVTSHLFATILYIIVIFSPKLSNVAYLVWIVLETVVCFHFMGMSVSC